MRDFWLSSGYQLLERDANGWLSVTDDFLRAYLLRPEMRPIDEACAEERALHTELLEDPRQRVPWTRVAALADPVARENYELVLKFRDRLLESGTLERCYLGLFGGTRLSVPPLFVDQLAHVILRSILDGTDDPFLLRAGELFFREQKVSLRDGAILLADADTVEMHATTGGFGDIGRLIMQAQTPLRSVELDILDDNNAGGYWARDERYDMVLNLSFGQRSLDALCRVLEAWIRHFLRVEVEILPVRTIKDDHWVWHLGLDIESTAILNDLYKQVEVGEDRLKRIVALFRLEFRDTNLMLARVAGRPVHMALAMTSQHTLRLKPQNLLLNLPLAKAA